MYNEDSYKHTTIVGLFHCWMHAEQAAYPALRCALLLASRRTLVTSCTCAIKRRTYRPTCCMNCDSNWWRYDPEHSDLIKMLINQVIIAFIVQLMTSVVDAVVNQIAMTPLTAVKTVLGDYICAIYPVAMTTILSISALQCSFECRRVNSCGGFNFRDNSNICELISANNVVFGVKQGCKYFTVSTLYFTASSPT